MLQMDFHGSLNYNICQEQLLINFLGLKIKFTWFFAYFVSAGNIYTCVLASNCKKTLLERLLIICYSYYRLNYVSSSLHVPADSYYTY